MYMSRRPRGRLTLACAVLLPAVCGHLRAHCGVGGPLAAGPPSAAAVLWPGLAAGRQCYSSALRRGARPRESGGEGPSASERHIAAEFGERWLGLLAALRRPKRYAAWVNPFTHFGDDGSLVDLLADCGFQRPTGTAGAAHLWVPQIGAGDGGVAYVERPRPHLQPLPKPPTCPSSGLKTYYPLDFASALPVLALLACLPPGARIFDACSAPGGKCLLLAGMLLARMSTRGRARDSAPGGERLTAMEWDKFRLSRLRQNLQLYLPEHVLTRVHALGGDASRPPMELRRETPFDGILVDAPCTSERERLLRDTARRSKAAGAETAAEAMPGGDGSSGADEDPPFVWDRRRSEDCAKRQVALLRSAMEMCAPHGSVVYSTCALSDIENDAVVEEALKGAPYRWHVHRGNIFSSQEGWSFDARALAEEADLTIEETRYGSRVLPDRGGWGPMYWSVLRGPAA